MERNVTVDQDFPLICFNDFYYDIREREEKSWGNYLFL